MTSDPYRNDEDEEGLPPRLWLPGRLLVRRDREIELGEQAGWSDGGKIERWACSISVVQREQLDEETIKRLGVVVPNRVVDNSLAPHTARWLRGQPLICVERELTGSLVKAGVRVYQIGYDRGSERLTFSARGAGPSFNLNGRHPARWVLQGHEPPDEAIRIEESLGATVIGRLLRGLSGGVLTESSVDGTLDARELGQPDFLWPDAATRKMLSVKDSSAAACRQEGYWKQVYERADEHMDMMSAFLRKFGNAPQDTLRITVPVYGAVVRSDLPSLDIDCEQHGISYRIGGDQQATLRLPAITLHHVEHHDNWRPDQSLKRGAGAAVAFGQEHRAQQSRALWLAIASVALFGAVIWWLLV